MNTESNEIVDRIIVLTKIHVHYTLRLPADAPRDKVDRSLETHVSKCPTAQSIKDSIIDAITTGCGAWANGVGKTQPCRRHRGQTVAAAKSDHGNVNHTGLAAVIDITAATPQRRRGG